MKDRLYPLDTHEFSHLIDSGCVYVDKTELIYQLTHRPYRYIVLSRSKGFGKSLLVSALEAYLTGQKSYFEGLRISQLEKEWTCYPTLRLDLARITASDPKQIHDELNAIIDAFYNREAFEIPNKQPADKLFLLVQGLYYKYKQKVVILIDDFDRPMLNASHSEEQLEAVSEVMYEFYAQLKPMEMYLHFVFIAGTTKFAQVSPFGGLNNINEISLDPEFASICGISKGELRAVFAADIEKLASTLNLSSEDAVDELKAWYGGYHFCWPAQEMFRPTSVFRCFTESRLSPWQGEFEISAGITEALKKNPIYLSRGIEGTISAFPEMFNFPIESNPEPLVLLYQAGYLTIKSADSNVKYYELGIPNKEIFEVLVSHAN